MKYACKHSFIIPEHLSSLHDHILVVMVLRHIFFDVIHITIFKTDVMMMKYMVRVEPPLMFNINRTRGNDVKEVILPIGWRRSRKREEPKRKIIARRDFTILKNSPIQQSFRLRQFLWITSTVERWKPSF